VKITKRVALLAFLILISAGFLSTTQADEDTYCYLEASVDVFVVVWSLDNLGNKGHLLWKGVVKPGKRKLIRTFDGKIRYASTRDYEDNGPLEGDRDRWCNDGGSIGVP